jgi:hypothetical protein
MAAVTHGSVSAGMGLACPRNDGGKVVRYGFRKRIDKIYARPRYRCSPPGGKAHYFTAHEQARETVARYIDHFAELVLCEVEHDAWPEVLVLDALPLRRREVVEDDPFSWEMEGNGAILFALGYTDPLPRRSRRSLVALRALTLAAQLNVLGDMPDEMLVGLAYASSPRPKSPKRLPHLWRVQVAGGLDRWSWLDFLNSLPGTPEWVVVDGDSAVRYAVEERWHGVPVLYSCEGHMKLNFQKRARDKDKLPGIDIWRLWPDYNRAQPDATRGPLFTPDDYRRFLDQLLTYPPDKIKNAASWVAHHDATVRRQFELRRPGYLRGIGGVEAASRKIDGWIGDRRRSFQNVRRLNLTLGLMRAQIAGHADPARYSRIIKEELERTNGRPELDWTAHNNQAGQKGLFELSERAELYAEDQKRIYWSAAQAATVERKVAVINAFHAIHGFPPVELTKAKTPAIKTTNKTVADFPLIAREWDPANPDDPEHTAAGGNDEVAWICYSDPRHRWRAKVGQRCGRAVGCPECGRVRGVAIKEEQPDLATIRARWGDYEDVTPVALSEVEEDALEVIGSTVEA